MSSKTDSTLDRLKQGIHRFQSGFYAEHVADFELAASTPQKPYALIITCADSRIHVETIVSANAGEIFAARNVGNLVPPYGEMMGGVSAVIEYAVDALKVKHVVVCGHMDCGAMKALKGDPKNLDGMPTVQNWLRNAAAARSVAISLSGEGEVPLHTLTEQNVLLQLVHLQTHPAVRAAMARGELTISGWVYDIGTGDVLIHNEDTDKFESTLAKSKETAAA